MFSGHSSPLSVLFALRKADYELGNSSRRITLALEVPEVQLPPSLLLESSDPRAAGVVGEYVLAPERFQGAGVWRHANGQHLYCQGGNWCVASDVRAERDHAGGDGRGNIQKCRLSVLPAAHD